jgi:AbrB family looped-hinge helix DNA binding protein
MNISKVSAKFQIVIPKELRKQLNIKPGQKVALSLDKNKNIKISTANPLDELSRKFGGRNIWGKDPAATIRQQRDEWDD